MNAGFVSFRFAGTDGVSLEAAKWAEVLGREGVASYYFGGELDTPAERSMEVSEAHFAHPEVSELGQVCFTEDRRPAEVTKRIHAFRERLKGALYEFLERFDIDVLIPQNALAIPMNIPLGLALTEVVAETGIRTLAHHHDFAWERQRFSGGCVADILAAAFPPPFRNITHVVINTPAQEQLALRRGLSGTLVPNVMDFGEPPRGIDEYNADFRRRLGIAADDLLILQPTRVVARKGIEHAVELTAALGDRAVLVLSHAAGDEGIRYRDRIERFAGAMGVRLVYADAIVGPRRGKTDGGSRLYDLEDAYAHADLVTYPSLIEGFGNAFLEAVRERKPLLVNRYPVYDSDIRPFGFDVVEMNGMIDDAVVAAVREMIENPGHREEAVARNAEIAAEQFSYERLAELLGRLL